MRAFANVELNPSYFGAFHKYTRDSWSLHPVEQVSWEECRKALERVGLVLPTEAQWEYSARAGTETPWWCGSKRSLKDVANLCDEAYTRGFSTVLVPEDWDDDFPAHAPVGSFLANDFGLHDVHGNVFEWCRDWYVPYEGGHRTGDGTLIVQPSDDGPRYRVDRGGSFSDSAIAARSALRDRYAPDGRLNYVGCRPAMAIELGHR